MDRKIQYGSGCSETHFKSLNDFKGICRKVKEYFHFAEHTGKPSFYKETCRK